MVDIPQEVWDDIRYEVGRHDLDCADNFRAYRYHDNYGRKEYREAEKRGCCGFFESHTSVDGVKWIIGCNYGH